MEYRSIGAVVSDNSKPIIPPLHHSGIRMMNS